MERQFKKSERFSLNDLKDLRTLEEMLSRRRSEEMLRDFIYETCRWQDAIDSVREITDHLGIWTHVHAVKARLFYLIKMKIYSHTAKLNLEIGVLFIPRIWSECAFRAPRANHRQDCRPAA